jgi:pSer/pThr/pTyr-binding forkhead associated (FHA) protein
VLSIGLQAEEARPVAPAAAAAPLDARIEGMGRVFPVVNPIFGIGNSADADIPIAHEAVATLHAQIVRHGDALYLRDSGSRTGTWLNDELLSATHALVDGDRLRIGPAELVFRSSVLKRTAAEESLVTIAVPHLEVRSGQSLGLAFTLRVESLVIGSAPGTHIELRDLSVAPQHARARMIGEQAYLADLGSGRGTYVAFTPIPSGQEVLLAEGAWIRVGIVDLVYTRRPMAVPAGQLRPRARLRVDTGPGAGASVDVRDRALVGSGPEATLRIPGLAHAHLEVTLANDRFLARDLSGGATFRSGSMLGTAPVPLNHGDSLLLAGSTMVRFEELP